MRQLEIKECQNRLLFIAKTLHSICEKHSIPFFMLGGTMLGAVRHGGFIPWDDDMDFGVPYNDYYRLMKILSEELPSSLRCVTYENNEAVKTFFMKVEDCKTVAIDVKIQLPLDKQLGLSVDIFPLVSCCDKTFVKESLKIRHLCMKVQKIFVESTERQWYKALVKKILRFLCPHDSMYYNKQIKRIVDLIKPGNFYANIVSPQFWNRPLPKEMIENLKLFKFEDSFFWGVADYDCYLSLLYKDYMKLPPKEKRRAHLDNVFGR